MHHNIQEKRPIKSWFLLILFMLFGLMIEVVTQSIIRGQPIPTCNITDRLLLWTGPLNSYFHIHTSATKFVLITTSLWFSFASLFLPLRALFGPSVRPYLSLFLFLILRQCLQLLVLLPAPADVIWYDPGFPGIFADYSAIGDFYFSAHAGVALLCALELARFQKIWLTIAGYFFFFYVATMVIVFRTHYTMDVFTALLAVYFVTQLSNQWSPYIDRWLQSSRKS